MQLLSHVQGHPMWVKHVLLGPVCVCKPCPQGSAQPSVHAQLSVGYTDDTIQAGWGGVG